LTLESLTKPGALQDSFRINKELQPRSPRSSLILNLEHVDPSPNKKQCSPFNTPTLHFWNKTRPDFEPNLTLSFDTLNNFIFIIIQSDYY